MGPKIVCIRGGRWFWTGLVTKERAHRSGMVFHSSHLIHHSLSRPFTIQTIKMKTIFIFSVILSQRLIMANPITPFVESIEKAFETAQDELKEAFDQDMCYVELKSYEDTCYFYEHCGELGCQKTWWAGLILIVVASIISGGILFVFGKIYNFLCCKKKKSKTLKRCTSTIRNRNYIEPMQ